MTPKTGVMMLKIQLCITGINSTFKYNTTENFLGWHGVIFHKSIVFHCIFNQINVALENIIETYFESINSY